MTTGVMIVLLMLLCSCGRGPAQCTTPHVTSTGGSQPSDRTNCEVKR